MSIASGPLLEGVWERASSSSNLKNRHIERNLIDFPIVMIILMEAFLLGVNPFSWE